MPSPGSRRRLEQGLRGAALAALAWLAWGTGRDAGPPRSRVVVSGDGIAGVAERWVAQPEADTLHVVTRRGLTADALALLRTLREAGTVVAWTDVGVGSLAVEAEAVADPAGGILLRAASPTGGALVIGDALGPLDSLMAPTVGAAVRVPPLVGPASVQLGGEAAVAPVPRPPAPLGAVVLGPAGWESRFVMAALEERGWRLDSRLEVAPGLTVAQGRPLPFDRARHAVVVVLGRLDPALARAVTAFVRGGGGVVVSGREAAGSLSAIGPGVVGLEVSPVVLGAPGAAPLDALPLDPIEVPAGDVVTLSAARGHVALAGRRYGAGRVVYVGYRDTWRWRLEGPEGAEADHRAWWTSVVSAAATWPAEVDPSEPGRGLGAAPRVALAAALGAPVTLPPTGRGSVPWWPVALALLVAALLAEWASRRLRGVP